MALYRLSGSCYDVNVSYVLSSSMQTIGVYNSERKYRTKHSA